MNGTQKQQGPGQDGKPCVNWDYSGVVKPKLRQWRGLVLLEKWSVLYAQGSLGKKVIRRDTSA